MQESYEIMLFRVIAIEREYTEVCCPALYVHNTTQTNKYSLVSMNWFHSVNPDKTSMWIFEFSDY
jgi:hypothetical protein